MKKNENGYNGHKNYETWSVCLWMDNDENLYDLAFRCRGDYRQFVNMMQDLGMMETPDGVRWDDPSLDIDGIEENMIEML